MKNYCCLFVFALLFSVSGFSQCHIASQSITEDFENPVNCWSFTATNNIAQNFTGVSGGVLRMIPRNIGSLAVLPRVYNGSGTLTFDITGLGAWSAGLMSSQGDGNSYTEFASGSINSSLISSRTVSFASYAGDFQYVAIFVTQGGFSNANIAIDNLSYTSGCPSNDFVVFNVNENISVSIDESGNGDLAVADIDLGSVTTCGEQLTALSIDKTTFTCADLGANDVTLTAETSGGSMETLTFSVNVEDDIAPTALGQDVTVAIDENTGLGVITADMIDNGSSDNCGLSGSLTKSLSKSVFRCEDTGDNTVTLLIEDAGGNIGTVDVNVTVTSNVIDEVISAANTDICTDGSSGTIISTGSSQSGFNYSLVNSQTDEIVDGPIEGTGSAIDFSTGNLTETTTFSVVSEKIRTATVSALEFDGVDDYVNFGTDNRGISTEISLAAWVKSSATSLEFLIAKYDGTNGYLLLFDDNGKAKIDGRDGSGSYRSSGASNTSINDGEWHYVVGTANLNTGNWRIYVDGVQENGVTYSAATTLASTANFYIGAQSANYFEGSMDQVTVWNTELDGSSISDLYNTCLTGTESGIVGHFNFDDGSGVTLTDLSSTALDGTLTNMDPASDWIQIFSPSCGEKACTYQMTTEVTVGDTSPPTLVLNSTTIQHTGASDFQIAFSDIDGGSSDNCSANENILYTLTPNSFECDTSGDFTISVEAEDEIGNISTQDVVVTIEPAISDQAVSASETELCIDGVNETTVQLASSDNGVHYYLRNSDNFNVDGPLVGDGGPLSFSTGVLTETSTYHVFGFVPSSASNSGLAFDGVNDEIEVPLKNSFTYESGFTLEARVKAPNPGASSHMPILSIGNSSDSDLEIYIQNNTNQLIVSQERGSSGTGGYGWAIPPNDVWFHLAVTFDGTNYKVYYDGIEQAVVETSFAPAGPLVRTPGLAFQFGRIDNTAFGAQGANFLGVLDEVRVWNGARSESELLSTMDNCLTGSEGSLQYYFPLNDGAGTIATELVDGSNGNMINMDVNTVWVNGDESLSCDFPSCSFQMTQEVTIGDLTAPTLAVQDVSIQHTGSEDFTITFDDIDAGSSDNCSADEDIVYTLTPNTVECGFSGDLTISVEAEDEAGNISQQDVVVTMIPALVDQVVSAPQTDFCIDGESAASIQLEGSTNGINYFLRDSDNAIIDGPQLGTGGPITFSTGVLTETTTYNVLAATDVAVDDNAVLFSGSRIEVPNSPSLQMESQWTLESWVKPQTPQLYIIETYDASGGFILRTHSSGLIQAYAMASETAFNIGASNTPLTLNEWNHVAVTFDEEIDEMNIYINGQLDKTISNMTINQQGSTTNIKIAARGDDEAMIGEQILDEVRIWNVARSAQDIAASMNSCLVGDEAGLVLYYDFKDLDIMGSDMTVTDKSTFGNDGTFEGVYETTDFVDPVSTSCASGAECSLQMSTEVTIGDTTPPIVVTQNVSLTLDPNTLTVSVLPEDLDDGSTDDCTDDESLTFTLSQSEFNCDHLGENTVSLIVSDDQGNTAEANATVTVSLTLATEDITAELDADGNVTIDPGSLYAGPVLICNEEIVVTVDQTTFSCADLGVNEVIVSADVNGTTVSSTAIVTVVDNAAPNIVSQDVVVHLDAAGQATIEAADLDNGSTDNCTAAESLIFSATQETFNCADVDANDQKTNNGVAVDLTIEDENGNSTTSTVFVTVLDTISPMAFAQDISVRLDENNSAVIDATMVDNGSSDNCSISSFSLSQTAFNDTHIGTNTVTLTAVDASGNEGNATATVTVDPYKQTQAITFESIPDKTYGDEDFTLSATSDASLSVSFSVVSGPVSVSGNTVTITGAGQAVIEARQEGNDDFLAAEPAQQSFDISTAVLEVLADDQTITYGDNLPTFSVSYNGFVNGESEADLDTAPSASTTATAASDAGIYDITASGGVSSNYAFSYVAGILTIEKASQTITLEAIDDKKPDDNPFDVVVSASSGLEVTLSVTGPATISGNTITLDGTEGTVTVNASQAGNVNYESVEATTTFEVQVVLGQPDAYELKIYPNPAMDVIQVKGLHVLEVRLYSMDGKLQLKSAGAESIDISELKSGVYLMEIKTEERVFTQRLMKN